MNIYYIKPDFVKYLQNYEKTKRGLTKVSNIQGDEYKNPRPYVGVLLKVGENEYFAPLTHPKEHYEENKKFFDRLSIKIVDDTNKDCGRLMFCYMIPVNKNMVEKLIIEDVPDQKYKLLLFSQYKWLVKNEETVCKRAGKLYEKIIGNPNHFLKRSCCDFELLEKACEEYESKICNKQ